MAQPTAPGSTVDVDANWLLNVYPRLILQSNTTALQQANNRAPGGANGSGPSANANYIASLNSGLNQSLNQIKSLAQGGINAGGYPGGSSSGGGTTDPYAYNPVTTMTAAQAASNALQQQSLQQSASQFGQTYGLNAQQAASQTELDRIRLQLQAAGMDQTNALAYAQLAQQGQVQGAQLGMSAAQLQQTGYFQALSAQLQGDAQALDRWRAEQSNVLGQNQLALQAGLGYGNLALQGYQTQSQVEIEQRRQALAEQLGQGDNQRGWAQLQLAEEDMDLKKYLGEGNLALGAAQIQSAVQRLGLDRYGIDVNAALEGERNRIQAMVANAQTAAAQASAQAEMARAQAALRGVEVQLELGQGDLALGARKADDAMRLGLEQISVAREELGQKGQIATQDRDLQRLLGLQGIAVSQAGVDTQRYGIQTTAQTNLALGNLDAQTRAAIANLDAQTRLQLQNSDTAAALQRSILDNQTRLQLGGLDAQTARDVATQQAITSLQLGQLSSATSRYGTDVNAAVAREQTGAQWDIDRLKLVAQLSGNPRDWFKYQAVLREMGANGIPQGFNDLMNGEVAATQGLSGPTEANSLQATLADTGLTMQRPGTAPLPQFQSPQMQMPQFSQVQMPQLVAPTAPTTGPATPLSITPATVAPATAPGVTPPTYPWEQPGGALPSGAPLPPGPPPPNQGPPPAPQNQYYPQNQTPPMANDPGYGAWMTNQRTIEAQRLWAQQQAGAGQRQIEGGVAAPNLQGQPAPSTQPAGPTNAPPGVNTWDAMNEEAFIRSKLAERGFDLGSNFLSGAGLRALAAANGITVPTMSSAQNGPAPQTTSAQVASAPASPTAPPVGSGVASMPTGAAAQRFTPEQQQQLAAAQAANPSGGSWSPPGGGTNVSWTGTAPQVTAQPANLPNWNTGNYAIPPINIGSPPPPRNTSLVPPTAYQSQLPPWNPVAPPQFAMPQINFGTGSSAPPPASTLGQFQPPAFDFSQFMTMFANGPAAGTQPTGMMPAAGGSLSTLVGGALANTTAGLPGATGGNIQAPTTGTAPTSGGTTPATAPTGAPPLPGTPAAPPTSGEALTQHLAMLQQRYGVDATVAYQKWMANPSVDPMSIPEVQALSRQVQLSNGSFSPDAPAVDFLRDFQVINPNGAGFVNLAAASGNPSYYTQGAQSQYVNTNPGDNTAINNALANYAWYQQTLQNMGGAAAGMLGTSKSGTIGGGSTLTAPTQPAAGAGGSAPQGAPTNSYANALTGGAGTPYYSPPAATGGALPTWPGTAPSGTTGITPVGTPIGGMVVNPYNTTAPVYGQTGGYPTNVGIPNTGNATAYYAAGTTYVPQDQLAVVHQGEAIIPANQNPYAVNTSPQAPLYARQPAAQGAYGVLGPLAQGAQTPVGSDTTNLNGLYSASSPSMPGQTQETSPTTPELGRYMGSDTYVAPDVFTSGDEWMNEPDFQTWLATQQGYDQTAPTAPLAPTAESQGGFATGGDLLIDWTTFDPATLGWLQSTQFPGDAWVSQSAAPDLSQVYWMSLAAQGLLADPRRQAWWDGLTYQQQVGKLYSDGIISLPQAQRLGATDMLGRPVIPLEGPASPAWNGPGAPRRAPMPSWAPQLAPGAPPVTLPPATLPNGAPATGPFVSPPTNGTPPGGTPPGTVTPPGGVTPPGTQAPPGTVTPPGQTTPPATTPPAEMSEQERLMIKWAKDNPPNQVPWRNWIKLFPTEQDFALAAWHAAGHYIPDVQATLERGRPADVAYGGAYAAVGR